MEFAGGIERIYLENGIPVSAEVILNNKTVSFTEFENGRPVTHRENSTVVNKQITVKNEE